MTYNFDPERWLELHVALLDERRRRGEIDDGTYHHERAELERRYDAMIERLDGTYRLPNRRRDGSG
jgi:hypothetical protein